MLVEILKNPDLKIFYSLASYQNCYSFDYTNLKAVNMSNSKNDHSRLELVKAGKLEERRAPRPSIILAKEEVVTEETEEGFKLTPEIIAIGLMVIMLLALTIIGF